MAVRMRDTVQGAWSELRFEPTEKRVRAALGDRDVVVTDRAGADVHAPRDAELVVVPLPE